MPETFKLSQTRTLADGSTVNETLTISLSDDPAQESKKPYDHETEGDFDNDLTTFIYHGDLRSINSPTVDFDKGLLKGFEVTRGFEATGQFKSYKLNEISSLSRPELLNRPVADHVVTFYYDGLLREVVNPVIVRGAYVVGRGYNNLLAGVEKTRYGVPTGQFKKYDLTKIVAAD
jgi:hypothetical protein